MKDMINGTHSIRCNHEMWFKAKEKAEKDGTNITNVMRDFLNGYVEGKFKAPKHTIDYNITTK